MNSLKLKKILPYLIFCLAVFGIATIVFSLNNGLLNSFFFGSDGKSSQGIDYFSVPKAYLNLLESRSMFDSFNGRNFGPYSTWYCFHPAFTLWVSSYLSFFSTWGGYWFFVFITLLLMGICGFLASRLSDSLFDKSVVFFLFFSPFLTYVLLYVGNMHGFTVLCGSLILFGYYRLAFVDEKENQIAKRMIFFGLLISLFSKPIILPLFPLLLINKETRNISFSALGIYVLISIIFQMTPFLNPESIGLGKVLKTALNPDFIKTNLNIYSNKMIVNEYMKDNSIHWFHIIAQSEYYWNHIDIFSFSAFLNSLIGHKLPGIYYKIPVMLIVFFSFLLLFIPHAKKRLEISLIIIVTYFFSYFLGYNTIWEYQFTSLFPAIAVLFLMFRNNSLPKSFAFPLFIFCGFYYLPTPYFLLDKQLLDATHVNIIRITRVLPAFFCFILLTKVLMSKLKYSFEFKFETIKYLFNKKIIQKEGMKDFSEKKIVAEPKPPSDGISTFPKNKLLFAFLAFSLVLIVFLTYSNHFNNPFHFDDFHTIVSNEYIRDLGNTFLFFKDATTTSTHPSNQAYRPLTTLSLAIDYRLGKGVESTFYFHLSNFLWFLIILFMIFLLMKIISEGLFAGRFAFFISWFAALFFGVLTSNAETINYIISRTDIISTAMVMIGLVIFIYYPNKRKFHFYMIPIIAGMFAKETTAVFPALAFSYLVLFELKLSLWQLLKPKIFLNALKPVFLSLVICGLLAVFVVKMISANWYVGNISRFDYLITQFFVFVHYFNTFFLPFNLSADTDWVRITNVFDDRVIIGFLFILGLIFIAFKSSEKTERRPITFGILWFFFALLPTSSIVPLTEVMNDHRIFFPFIGLTISACWTLYLIFDRWKEIILKRKLFKYGGLMLLAIIICSHIYGTYQRNKIWSSDTSLWYDVTIKSPANGRGLMNYGLALMRKADYEGALTYFEKALVYTPYYSYLHINLGILKSAMGKNDEAEKYFKNGIQYSYKNPEHLYFYAEWLRKQNRISEAITQLEKAVELSPGHSSSKILLNELKSIQGKSNVEIAEEKVKLAPSAENYINLSLEYYNAKRFEDCIKACNEALKLKPGYDVAYNNICSSYNALQKWDKAIEACEKGLRINQKNQLIKNNLALAKNEKEKK